MNDVLALIDGAVGDWEMSGDAMRWRPEKPVTDRVPSQYLAQMRVGMEQFNAQWSRIHQGLIEAFQQIGEQVSQLVPVIEAVGELLDQPAAATRGAASPRVPAYRDGRPRWQSPYGPQRAR